MRTGDPLPNARAWFAHRRLVIATKHHKERVIAPLVENALGVHSFVPEHFDTDLLGTFTGEVERTGDPLTTLRTKCRLALEATGCDLGIASEGSFGPHPTLYFVPAGEEWLLLLDRKHGLEVVVREISTHTNYGGSNIGSEAGLRAFAAKSGFPSHALVLRNREGGNEKIVKGITGWDELLAAYADLRHRYGSAWVETDMRAHFNPTRMDVIAAATRKLLDKVNSCCPACGTPGFGVTDVQSGLPCSWCGTPTASTLLHRYCCARCSYEQDLLHPHGKTTEDPMYCPACNP
ncbi:MAG TPA: hypothetical protein PKE63_03870 [Lacibacter sp.]|nr:hypothetical protein [Lacibacter sp.]HMO88470.1 hypothetical protein [Lacibacter sp.]HMP86388.1 hypothetical protein [Lacibacter sp.]